MKVWPIDPLFAWNLSTEVPEKLPQGLTVIIMSSLNFSSSDASYIPQTSSGFSSSPPVPGALADLKKDVLILSCINDPEEARNVLNRLPTVVNGWCLECTLKPTKEGGYIQVSSGGVNKFAVLQHLVLWASGSEVNLGEQASHLCHNPRCTRVGHVVAESEIENQRRKGCPVWVNCYHLPNGACSIKADACLHTPQCIKYCPGFADENDFRLRGLHARPT